MIENTAKECVAQSQKELQENTTANLDEKNSCEINNNELVLQESETAIQRNLDDVFHDNHAQIEALKRDTQSKNEQNPNFFTESWEDVPYKTDEETGEKIYEVNSGKKDEDGNDNPEHDLLNQHPLPADATIIVHNPNGTVTIYKTDHLGRVKSMETSNVVIVDENDRERNKEKGRSNETGKTKNIKDGKSDDEGGHLLGDQFGGCLEQINLVPMSFETNRKAFGKIERTIAKAIKEGHTVTDYKVEPIYEGDSSRPVGFKMTYKVDGKPFTTIITN